MRSVAGQFLLESWLVPFIVAGLITYPSRWSDQRLVRLPIMTAALIGAVGATYILAFGWPAWTQPSARQKILLAPFLTVAVWLISDQRWRRLGFVVALLLPVIWIAMPLLLRGLPEDDLPALLTVFLPVAIGLWSGYRHESHLALPRDQGVMLVAFALGLTGVAIFAQTFSLAALSLALAASLTAISMVGRMPVAPSILLAAGSMLLGLATAMTLYSDASRPALFMLALVAIADILTDGLSRHLTKRWRICFLGLCCALPTALAIAIARIDAGPFSLY
ncbi:MAG: hypothetical protein ACR2Q4_05105 [Geminicoccaceae bacterium]